MKKAMAVIFLTILLVTILAYTGDKLLPDGAAADLTVSEDRLDAVPAASQSQAPEKQLSCATLTPANEAACQATSDEILASTVRIMIYSSIMYVEGHGYLILNGNGYATIKDGRYLVSHNHYNETVFSMLQAGDPDNLLFINVYDAKGGILLQVPAQTVTVALAEGETSVWDFGQVDGVGVFASLGLPSAQFMTGQRLALKPGMEVAQIDWDGHTSYVTWTTIEAAKDVSDIPALKLTSCIRDGASGGGLFWQGIHVGNNWSRSPECDFESAPSSAQYSFVTLNTESVVAPS